MIFFFLYNLCIVKVWLSETLNMDYYSTITEMKGKMFTLHYIDLQ